METKEIRYQLFYKGEKMPWWQHFYFSCPNDDLAKRFAKSYGRRYPDIAVKVKLIRVTKEYIEFD